MGAWLPSSLRSHPTLKFVLGICIADRPMCVPCQLSVCVRRTVNRSVPVPRLLGSRCIVTGLRRRRRRTLQRLVSPLLGAFLSSRDGTPVPCLDARSGHSWSLSWCPPRPRGGCARTACPGRSRVLSVLHDKRERGSSCYTKHQVLGSSSERPDWYTGRVWSCVGWRARRGVGMSVPWDDLSPRPAVGGIG